MENISTYASVKRYDPTQTTALRNAFARDMKKRFIELKRIIKEAVIEQDCFGLNKNRINIFQMNPPGREVFAFMRDPEKIDAFMRWLQVQVDKGLLTVGEFRQSGTSIENAWTDKYILDSYKRGVMRARDEMRKAGYPVPTLDEAGGIAAIMSMPMHMDRVGLLYTRMFTGLNGITAQMDVTLSQILSQGMIDGDGSRTIARKLVAAIDGTGAGTLELIDKLGRFIPAQRRADTLVRTEMIRAYHLASIQEYRNWGVEGVYVMAEWVTSGDDRVCGKCAELEGKKFTLDQIEGMIPYHPRCRCMAMPYLAELEKYYKK
jgi:SPP1 gp7 family putative phage head morphogenesis protein